MRGDVIVGGKLGIVQNRWGLIADWDCATANVHDRTFLPLLANYDGQMIILTDTGFHRAKGDPANRAIAFEIYRPVSPAKAGAQRAQNEDNDLETADFRHWIPAFAGMTVAESAGLMS